jgi:hypothetical protein
MIFGFLRGVAKKRLVRGAIRRWTRNVLALVLRCLAKDPAQRFQDARSLELALAAVASGLAKRP